MKRYMLFSLVIFALASTGLLAQKHANKNNNKPVPCWKTNTCPPPLPPGWTTSSTVFVPVYDFNGGHAFDFPVEDGTFKKHVNYLLFPYTQALSGNLVAQFSVNTSGPGVQFNYQFVDDPGNTCITPASTRLFVYAANLNGIDSQYWRWWSNPTSFTLGPASVELNVPIDPSQWTSVYGQRGTDNAAALAGFNAAMAQPTQFGFSFGGGCFFGHGVNVSGGMAQFVVWTYGATGFIPPPPQ